MRWIICVLCVSGVVLTTNGPASVSGQTGRAAAGTFEYVLLSTTRTSTLEREMNEAAEDGYRFQEVMGGDTAFGGSEVVAIMMRGSTSAGRFAYRLLATNRTSTMQEEMQEAGGEGYRYRGQTVFDSLFGGEEVVVIMERDDDAPPVQYDFLLLATSQTSTLQTELTAAGQRGFELAGLTVGRRRSGVTRSSPSPAVRGRSSRLQRRSTVSRPPCQSARRHQGVARACRRGPRSQAAVRARGEDRATVILKGPS